MISAGIFLGALTAGFIIFCKILISEEKLVKQLKGSPDLMVLFEYSKKKKIKFSSFPMDGQNEDYSWSAHPSLSGDKVISISVDAKTGKILPKDLFLQKIIFAHEISHIEQDPTPYIAIKYSCKKFRDAPPCLYLELNAWEKAFKLLGGLNLFRDGKERREFWHYVRSKANDSKHIPCRQKVKNGECLKTLELREKISKDTLLL